MSLWKRIFDTLQDPKELFSECIKHGLIHEAAYLLRILQQTEGISYAYSSAHKLLQPALAANYFELAKDMTRFIHTIESETITKPSLVKSPVIQGWLYDNSLLQMIVLRQCRVNLMKGNLHELSEIAKTFNLPLSQWLQREK